MARPVLTGWRLSLRSEAALVQAAHALADLQQRLETRMVRALGAMILHALLRRAMVLHVSLRHPTLPASHSSAVHLQGAYT